MSDTPLTPQQKQERKARLEEGKRLFNDLMHNPPNKVQVSRLDTRDDVNARIRKAAGRGTTDEGDGAA